MTYYSIKMISPQTTALASVPTEFAKKGLDGFKEYVTIMRSFYPNTKFEIFEVTEKLIEF